MASLFKRTVIFIFSAYLCFSDNTECYKTADNERFKGINCTIEKLDDKSWKECGDKGYTMNCGSLNLRTVPHSFPALVNFKSRLTPPLCLLNLSYNSLDSLKNNSFVHTEHMNSTDVMWLYLQYCRLRYIESNAFINLTRLVYLNLTKNFLTWPDGFGVGVFRPLVSLRNINLYDNNITTFKGLGQEMQYMKQLMGIFIELCENCTFGEGFESLTNLVNLTLSRVQSGSCRAPVIRNDTFKYVPRTKHLYIGSCHIHEVEADAFSPLKELVKLDLSYNKNLKFEGMNKALYGLRNSTTLKVLNVNRIYPEYGIGVMLELKHMENLKTLQALEELHMDLNKIEVFEEEILFPHFHFPETLRCLTLSGNRLSYDNYSRHIDAAKNIEYLDISRQHLDYDPFISDHFGRDNNVQPKHIDDTSVVLHSTKPCSCKDLGVLCLPENVRSIKWRKSFIWLEIDTKIPEAPYVTLCGAKNLQQLDVSFNLITKWNSGLNGFENLTDLDLSENYCDSIAPAFFNSFQGLQILNISGNLLGNALNQLEPSTMQILFENLTNLQTLDLSSNRITHLHEDMFQNLMNIKHLYLGRNLLTKWNASLEKSRCLKLLDLADNKLNVIDEATTKYLDSLVSEPCYNTEIIVNLTDNPLECACNHLYFLRWLRDTEIKVNVSNASDCSIEGKRYPLTCMTDLKYIINTLENDICKDRTWITWTASIASVVCSGLLSALLCILVYKNRWKLRYLYYTRHRRHIVEGYERLFQYDAFISYAKTFGSFMKHTAVPALEEIHNLSTWVYDKNCVPGISMAENITHAISNSKKAVLLINRNFLKDSWCEYETNMAVVESITTKRNMLVIVIMDQIDMNELPIYIQKLLKSERSLEYPENRHDESTFWMNLAEEIKS